MQTRPARLERLLAHRGEFLRSLTRRLGGDRATAEDLLQNGLMKVLVAPDPLRDETRLIPWFHRLLRHLAVDHIRSRRAAETRHRRWSDESRATLPLRPRAGSSNPCPCLAHAAQGLPPTQAALIRRVSLGGESIAQVAVSLGLRANAAAVALHRARCGLRLRLETLCGVCAETACLACDCTPPDRPSQARP